MCVLNSSRYWGKYLAAMSYVGGLVAVYAIVFIGDFDLLRMATCWGV